MNGESVNACLPLSAIVLRTIHPHLPPPLSRLQRCERRASRLRMGTTRIRILTPTRTACMAQRNSNDGHGCPETPKHTHHSQRVQPFASRSAWRLIILLGGQVCDYVRSAQSLRFTPEAFLVTQRHRCIWGTVPMALHSLIDSGPEIPTNILYPRSPVVPDKSSVLYDDYHSAIGPALP